MSKATASLRSLTGPARILVLLVVAWVVVFASIWGYTTHRMADVNRQIDDGLADAELLVKDGKDVDAGYVMDRVENYVEKYNELLDWADRAKWTGPIGLAAILFFGIGGQWVYRGFRTSQGNGEE